MTFHKSQGQTLPQVVVDLGKAEKAAVSSFVAISRVRSLQNSVLQPLLFQRPQAIGKSTGKSPRRRKVKKSSRSYRAST